jgi:UDP-N-acetylglucosamine diphosphorylase/glucosamine-1-phosphate N-acetyltransferase
MALVFEDLHWRRLYPITLSRASFEVRVGATTLGQRLAAQLGGHDVKRVDFLCRPVLRPLVERDHPSHRVNPRLDGEDVTFLNGRLLCLDRGLEELLELVDKSVAVQEHGELLACRLSGDSARMFAEELGACLERGHAAPVPSDHTTAPLPGSVRAVRYPWDPVAWNADALLSDFEWAKRVGVQHPPELAPGAQTLHRDHLLSREGVRIEAGAIVDAGGGPVILGDNVRVLHNAVIVGPAYIGPGSVVRVGAKLEGPVSIGPRCKVGGEIEGSILQGYANKQHDGFLGHAYLGAWTNLGAATNNSDLKNNYSTVRIPTLDGEVDTGQRLVGVFMGDHSKTAIGTTFNTGTVVGFACNLFGPGFPPKHVPSFSWGGAEGFIPHDLERAIKTARAVMGRRQRTMEPADEVLFRSLYEERERF